MQKLKNQFTLSEFEKIFNRLYAPLCLFANKYVDDLSLSKDIVQNVFIKVWEDKVIFQDKKKIEEFFYTAVRNKSLDYLRSKCAKDFKVYPTEDLKTLQTENYFITETIIWDTSAIIQNAMNSLPKKTAQAIRLSIEDYNNR